MIDEIRELLGTERYGVLSTLSVRHAGWPFGTIVPYALNDDGEPLLLLSDLADHTRNLHADRRASLLVRAQRGVDDDPQAKPRVTLLGSIEGVSQANQAAARLRFAQRHPQSEGYLQLADFQMYVLHVAEARYIKGFGEMGWVNLQKETV